MLGLSEASYADNYSRLYLVSSSSCNGRSPRQFLAGISQKKRPLKWRTLSAKTTKTGLATSKLEAFVAEKGLVTTGDRDLISLKGRPGLEEPHEFGIRLLILKWWLKNLNFRPNRPICRSPAETANERAYYALHRTVSSKHRKASRRLFCIV